MKLIERVCRLDHVRVSRLKWIGLGKLADLLSSVMNQMSWVEGEVAMGEEEQLVGLGSVRGEIGMGGCRRCVRR